MKKTILIVGKIFIIFIFLIIDSCTKSTNNIPYSSISFQLYLSQSNFNTLLTPGNWLYITGGSNGLIVCNSPSNSGQQNPFIILDRTCTYNPSNGYVQVMSDNIHAMDSTCHSKFSIY